ncbi:unnamed protein product [Darwinula stevensoni]|uniref:Uncharacterized protein n=1 Tax=Darwinula stevensoni TaxID=69355 RepID=A0A7R8XKS2_9CRUS|nr:unnamed protein product [Darwinula stevensoni]CAG0895559.1 unnamed protein product [Darwinula stevensoni]
MKLLQKIFIVTSYDFQHQDQQVTKSLQLETVQSRHDLSSQELTVSRIGVRSVAMASSVVESAVLLSLNALSLFVLQDSVVTDVFPVSPRNRSKPISFDFPVDLLPYVNQGESAFHEVKDLLVNGVWDLERDEDGIVVKSLYSKKYSNYIFLAETVVNASAEALVDEYWWHFDRITTWNTAHDLLDTKRMVEDFYICYISTEFPGAPPEGKNHEVLHTHRKLDDFCCDPWDAALEETFHPDGFQFSPNWEGSAKFQTVMNADVKLYAALKPLHRVYEVSTLFEYATRLRDFASRLRDIW